MNNKPYLLRYLIILICYIYSPVKAAGQTKADTIAEFAKLLSADTEKVVAIRSFSLYRSDDIKKLMGRTDISLMQRQAQLKILLDQRKVKLDSVLTPGLKMRLSRLRSGEDSIKAKQLHEEAIFRHDRSLSKPGHVQKTTKVLVKPLANR